MPNSFKLTSMKATIPTQAYGNLQPEVSGEDINVEEAKAFFQQMHREAKEFVAMPNTNTSLEWSTLQAINGTQVQFNDLTHTYKGDWMSGSAYAKQFTEEPPLEMLATKLATEDKPAEEFLKEWNRKGEMSREWGNAVHHAMELWANFDSEIKNPYLADLVEDFRQYHPEVVTEVFVADELTKRCGFVDYIWEINGKEIGIGDFKTSADLNKRVKMLPPYDELPNKLISQYALQLNFYRTLLEASGYDVKQMEIAHEKDGKWEFHQIEEIDIQ